MKYLLAQITNPALDPKVGTGDPVTIFNTFVGNWISIAYIFGILSCLTFLIISAIQMSTAGEDKQRIATLKNRMTYAILGLVLLFSVLALMKIIGFFFGISSLENLIFDLSPIMINSN